MVIFISCEGLAFTQVCRTRRTRSTFLSSRPAFLELAEKDGSFSSVGKMGGPQAACLGDVFREWHLKVVVLSMFWAITL